MKTNNIFLKIVFLYFYMYFIGPIIWGVWMIYKLKIITLEEYCHSLLSPVTIIMFCLYFLFNLFYMMTLFNKTSNFSSALKVHCLSLLSFGTVGTSIFMSLLPTNNFSHIEINQSDWLLKAIIGSLSGASLVFLFYIFFSAIIFTSIIDTTKTAQQCEVRKTLLSLKVFNLAVYILGMILFIGTAVASFVFRYKSISHDLITRETAIFGVTMVFPILMSGLLYLKSIKKIDSFFKPVVENSIKPNKIRIKLAVQLLFLFVFFVLLLIGKIQAWLFILVTGFITSLLIGRVYCGWCCPVNTVNYFINMLYKLLRLKKRAIPKFLQHRIIRIMSFTLFVGLFIFSLLIGKRLQLFTIITFSGVLVSSIFVSAFWCNYLCPWGTLMRITNNRLQCLKCTNKCPKGASKP